MSSTVLIGLLAVMVGTSFLSGIFGMAGGMILMGILLWMFPVPEAMALHAVAQIASNGWRGLLWIRFVRWRAVAAYAAGCLLALLAWSLVRYVPAKAHALIALGILPFMVQALPKDMTPDPERPADGT
ncbi:MAG TPA: TSUP family transporter, partial [Hyphomicrobiaceae bacterium]|nr:TSUP family transporter [Hyphomicrobiaceae bacterium]